MRIQNSKFIFYFFVFFNANCLFGQRDGHYWGDDYYASIASWILFSVLVLAYYIIGFLFRVFDPKSSATITQTIHEQKNKPLIQIFSVADDGIGLISINFDIQIRVLNVTSNLLLGYSEVLRKDDSIKILVNSLNSVPIENLQIVIIRYSNKLTNDNINYLTNNVIKYWDGDLGYWTELNFSSGLKYLIEDEFYQNKQIVLKELCLNGCKMINLSTFRNGDYVLSIKGEKGNYIWKKFSIL